MLMYGSCGGMCCDTYCWWWQVEAKEENGVEGLITFLLTKHAFVVQKQASGPMCPKPQQV